MRILALLARKGGAGKTTLAAHLAVLAARPGKRVLLIDTDPQRSLTRWYQRRKWPEPQLAEVPISRLPEALEAARGDAIDLVVIDTRPSVEAETARIASLADFCVVPTRPAILDLDAIADTVGLLLQQRRRGAIVLNACPPRRGAGEASVTVDARKAVTRFGLPVAPMVITDRVALSHALIDGSAVTEFEPAGKASAELKALWKWIEDTAWPRAARR